MRLWYTSSCTTSLPLFPISSISTSTNIYFAEICGDGICDEDESCSSCFFDCGGSCGYGACPGTPECSGHGSCVNGLCSCNDINWNGPACELNGRNEWGGWWEGWKEMLFSTGFFTQSPPLISGTPPPVQIEPNPSNPETSVTLSDVTQQETSGNVSFLIAFSSIEEVTSVGRIASTLPCPQTVPPPFFWHYKGSVVIFSLKSTNFSTTHSKRSDGSNAYTTTLPNSATIEILFATYDEATQIDFAGEKLAVLPNSIKISMRVSYTSLTRSFEHE